MARSIEVVDKVFDTAEAVLDYLDDLNFPVWRPRFVTVHHTGAPDLKLWEHWQPPPPPNPPVTDEQWLKNLGVYYATAVPGVKSAWSAGPHFFITPRHICVLSPPQKRGVHAVSFNSVSWGVECVGNFDVEPFQGPIVGLLVGALAAMHVALGIQPDPFEKGVRGLHFHRDDPLTSKTCPGKNVFKGPLVAAVKTRMMAMTPGDHPDEEIKPVTPQPGAPPSPVVAGVVTQDDLNVRVAASAKSQIVRTLNKGDRVRVLGTAMNRETKWLQIEQNEWVAAAFVKLG